MPSSQIDDRETAHSERHAIFDQRALIIRTAMPDGEAHTLENPGTLLGITRALLVPQINESSNTTHLFLSPTNKTYMTNRTDLQRSYCCLVFRAGIKSNAVCLISQ